MPFAPVVTAHPTTHRQFFASPGRRREEFLEASSTHGSQSTAPTRQCSRISSRR